MKKWSQKSQISDPVREDIRHLGVMVEDIQHQVHFLADGMIALREDVDVLKQDVHAIKLTLNEHSKILDEHSKEFKAIRADLRKKVDYDEFFPLTQRVVVLEKKC